MDRYICTFELMPYCTIGLFWEKGNGGTGLPGTGDQYSSIQIGFDQPFPAIIATFIHECFEVLCCLKGLRYQQSPSGYTSTSTCMFHFNHTEYAEIVEYLGLAVVTCYTKIQKAYKEYKKNGSK